MGNEAKDVTAQMEAIGAIGQWLKKLNESFFMAKKIIICRNPSLGLTTKARGCKVAGQEGDLGVTSHSPRNAKSVRE
jgi:hypothetical protein